MSDFIWTSWDIRTQSCFMFSIVCRVLCLFVYMFFSQHLLSKKEDEHKRNFGELTSEEYKDTENIWIKDCQQELREKCNPQLQFNLGPLQTKLALFDAEANLQMQIYHMQANVQLCCLEKST